MVVNLDIPKRYCLTHEKEVVRQPSGKVICPDCEEIYGNVKYEDVEACTFNPSL